MKLPKKAPQTQTPKMTKPVNLTNLHKGVWGLGGAVMYTCAIITISHCMPELRKKKLSIDLGFPFCFVFKNSLKSSIF